MCMSGNLSKMLIFNDRLSLSWGNAILALLVRLNSRASSVYRTMHFGLSMEEAMQGARLMRLYAASVCQRTPRAYREIRDSSSCGETRGKTFIFWRWGGGEEIKTGKYILRRMYTWENIKMRQYTPLCSGERFFGTQLFDTHTYTAAPCHSIFFYFCFCTLKWT